MGFALNFWSSKEKNNREGTGEKNLEKENVWSAKGEGIGGKCHDGGRTDRHCEDRAKILNSEFAIKKR